MSVWERLETFHFANVHNCYFGQKQKYTQRQEGKMYDHNETFNREL